MIGLQIRPGSFCKMELFKINDNLECGLINSYKNPILKVDCTRRSFSFYISFSKTELYYLIGGLFSEFDATKTWRLSNEKSVFLAKPCNPVEFCTIEIHSKSSSFTAYMPRPRLIDLGQFLLEKIEQFYKSYCEVTGTF